MSIALAATWNPRGELERFEQLLPMLEEVYAQLVISFPPVADEQVVQLFREGRFSGRANITMIQNLIWPQSRYMAVKTALQKAASHIHYADMDRLLRWAETRPEEWRTAVARI